MEELNNLYKKMTDTLRSLSEMVKVHRKKALSSVLSISLLASGSFIGNQFYQSQLVDRYQVYFDGRPVGYVNSKGLVEEWVAKKIKEEESAYGGVPLSLKNEITYRHERVFKGEYDNGKTLSALERGMDVKATAYQLVVNGKVLGTVRSETEGKTLLEKVKANYTKPFAVNKSKENRVTVASVDPPNAYGVAQNGEKLISAKFKEPVQFKQVEVDPAQLSNSDQLYQIMQKGTLEQKTYQIQEGDTLSGIAHKFGLKTSQLIALNSSVNEETVLQIGQKLNVTALNPQVTVEMVTQKTNQQAIPYQTKYVEDKSMYKGQTKVKQQGEQGKVAITVQFTKENGAVVNQKEIGRTVLDQPVDQIIIKGIKQPPIIPTGKFAWPVRGGFVTSGFGYRWGSMHPAIDISGAKDKTIMASDNGKVIEAGWDGSYGNNILISHGNGYVTRYSHLSKINVKVGQKVAKGQKLGVMGETGNATGVHLHFEIIKNGTPLNPSKFF